MAFYPQACSLETGWQLNGLAAIVLTSPELRVVALPGLGGRLISLEDRLHRREWLYRHPRVAPRVAHYGANYDDWWSGGVDECCPTGWACEFEGQHYPLLGELWSQAWDCQPLAVGQDEVAVELNCRAVVAPLAVSRVLRLKAGASSLWLEHRLTNLSDRRFPLLWGLHPAFALGHTDYRFDLPATRAHVDEGSPDYPGPEHATYLWPFYHDGRGPGRDMRQMRPASDGTWYLHHAEVQGGWLALTDLRLGAGVALTFEQPVLNSVSLWGVWGGWRPGVHTFSPEPWTGSPSHLTRAVEGGRVAWLGPEECIEFRTAFHLYDGTGAIRGVDPQGQVEWA